jgi:hypothetical protein
MNRRQYARRNQNAVSFVARNKTLGPVSNTIILIILGCLIGLLYLTQVTRTNIYGYTINSLQEQQLNLQNERDNLVVNAARLQSLDRVTGSDVAKSLVSATPAGTVSQ